MYNAYNESGVQTNEEVMALLGWSNDKVRNIKAKLKIRGFIYYTFGSPVKILKPYREVVDTPETFKAQIYREMLEVYMEDCTTCPDKDYCIPDECEQLGTKKNAPTHGNA